MDNETKLEKLREVLNEYIKYLHLYNKVSVEVITKNKLECRREYTYPDKYGDEQIGNILSVEKIPPTEYIRIVYYDCVRPGWESVFQSIEIPWEKVDKRIEHYKGKIDRFKETVV